MLNPEETIVDLAVIGGGIAGGGIARDAALRGLSVALFEKAALGSGTSSKSSKLIHGGLRYLETAWAAFLRGRFGEAWKNFHFVFASLRESRILERIAPDLIRPIELVLPVYRGGRSLLTVFTGAAFYFGLGILSGGARPPRFFWGDKAILQFLPGLRRDSLCGGVLIWDRSTDDNALVVETIRSAQRHGAVVFEHAVCESWKRDADLYHIRVRTAQGLRSFRARKVINASGPWVDKVRHAAGDSALLQPVAGCHILLPKFLPHSAILEAPDGRLFFVINTPLGARIGTTERPHRDPDTVEATPEEIDYLFAALKQYFPDLKLGREDILSVDAGLRPLAKPAHESAMKEISREHRIHVDADGSIHVLGVKLTDHRRAAELLIDMLVPEFRRLGRTVSAKTKTHLTPLSA